MPSNQTFHVVYEVTLRLVDSVLVDATTIADAQEKVIRLLGKEKTVAEMFGEATHLGLDPYQDIDIQYIEEIMS